MIAELIDETGYLLVPLGDIAGSLRLLAYLALATPRGFQPRDTLLALFWSFFGSDSNSTGLCM